MSKPIPNDDQDQVPQFDESWLDAKVPVEVNGKTVQLPLKDVMGGYQQATAGQEKLREAARLRKENERALERDELLQEAIRTGSTQAFVQAFRLHGLTDAQIDQLVKGSAAAQNPPARGRQVADDEDSAFAESEEIAALREQLEQVTQVVTVLRDREKERYTTDEAGVRRREIDNELDNDPKLGKLIARYPKDQQPEVRSFVYETVAKKAKSREYKDRVWGPSVIRAGLDEAQRRLTLLGATPPSNVPDSSEQPEKDQVAFDEATATFLGIPRGGSAVSPDGGVSVIEKLSSKRVDHGHDDRAGYVLARLAKFVKEDE